MNLGLTSTEFLLLLPIVILMYYLIPKKIRQYFLLVINLLFYASFGYVFLIYLLAEAVLIWLASLIIDRHRDQRKTKISVATAGIVLMASLLLFFKISPRYTDTIVAPLGFSFYTLQAISYLIDVSKGDIVREKNLFKLLTFLSFFPTVTSGPIFRFDRFIEQYNDSMKLKPDYDRITNGIIYMIYGYFLKLVVAERAAIPVNHVFDTFGDAGYGGVLLFVIAITYSFQIYADFAGYSAIVIGIAQILGYDIPENFRAPYLSASIKEFWGRWHISLSSWLKEYIYIPLGGNRKGRARKYINIIITFLISGLWHGTRMHFLVWGCMHGVYQIVGDITQGVRHKLLPYIGIKENSLSHRFLQRVVTFFLVTLAWIFFRIGTREAVDYVFEMITTLNIGGMISGSLWGLGIPPFGWILLGICALLVSGFDIILYKKNMRMEAAISSQGILIKCIFIIILSLAVLILGIYGDQHDASYFIYRDF